MFHPSPGLVCWNIIYISAREERRGNQLILFNERVGNNSPALKRKFLKFLEKLTNKSKIEPHILSVIQSGALLVRHSDIAEVSSLMSY